MTTLVWFKNDLRTLDNEALYKACTQHQQVVCLYVLDPRQFGKGMFGFKKTGIYRVKFLIETLSDLKAEIEFLGGELIIKSGKPEEIVPQIATEISASKVYYQKEYTDEEKQIEAAIEQELWKHQISFSGVHGLSMLNPEDLPYPIRSLPDVFTDFRKGVEKAVKVRKPLPKPEAINSVRGIESESLPTLSSLGYDLAEIDLEQYGKSVLDFKGGEAEALSRLDHYLWGSDAIATYKETRNGMLGGDYSSKFSPWLANGSLSARVIYHEIKKYEADRVANQSTYWLIFELLWRDYFKFIAKKYGTAIFKKGGIRNKPPRGANYKPAIEQWINGETGDDFVDANMRELKHTGFMSNRGRQNVASFLVHELFQNWQIGAAYFEEMLIDYDPASNWGNWNYVSGIGNDPRENRIFNTKRQASMYDPEGDYRRHWLDEELVVKKRS